VRGLVWLTVSVYFLQLMVFTALVWKQHSFQPLEPVPSTLVRRVLRYCIGILIITFTNAIIWQRSETLFLGRYSTENQIAYYGLAYNIAGTLVTMIPFALSRVLMPALSQYSGAGNQGEMQRIYAATTKYVCILTLALGTIAIAGSLVSLIYGPIYLPVVGPLRILLLGSMIGAVAGPGSALFLALGKPHLVILWGIPNAILNLVLAYILVLSYGAVGAAIANTVCQTLGVLAGTTYLLRFARFRLPFSALFRIILAAIPSAGLAYLVTPQLTGWAGLLASVALGAAVYISILIIIGVLDSSDYVMLRGITNLLPYRVGLLVKRMLDFTEAASLWFRHIVRTRSV
jgi:O-antigen/teichoic acid export membrane protein